MLKIHRRAIIGSLWIKGPSHLMQHRLIPSLHRRMIPLLHHRRAHQIHHRPVLPMLRHLILPTHHMDPSMPHQPVYLILHQLTRSMLHQQTRSMLHRLIHPAPHHPIYSRNHCRTCRSHPPLTRVHLPSRLSIFPQRITTQRQHRLNIMFRSLQQPALLLQSRMPPKRVRRLEKGR